MKLTKPTRQNSLKNHSGICQTYQVGLSPFSSVSIAHQTNISFNQLNLKIPSKIWSVEKRFWRTSKNPHTAFWSSESDANLSPSFLFDFSKFKPKAFKPWSSNFELQRTSDFKLFLGYPFLWSELVGVSCEMISSLLITKVVLNPYHQIRLCSISTAHSTGQCRTQNFLRTVRA